MSSSIDEPRASLSATPQIDEEKVAASPVMPPSAPDGGLAAWTVVLGTWCTSFCSFGWLNSIGVFQEYYKTNLLNSYSPSTISWIPSLQIVFMMGLVRPCTWAFILLHTV